MNMMDYNEIEYITLKLQDCTNINYNFLNSIEELYILLNKHDYNLNITIDNTRIGLLDKMISIYLYSLSLIMDYKYKNINKIEHLHALHRIILALIKSHNYYIIQYYEFLDIVTRTMHCQNIFQEHLKYISN